MAAITDEMEIRYLKEICVTVTHLLAVLQHTLFGSYAALGSGRVGFPAAGLNVDVHVEFSAEHRHLWFGHGKACARVGCQCLHKDKETEKEREIEMRVNVLNHYGAHKIWGVFWLTGVRHCLPRSLFS